MKAIWLEIVKGVYEGKPLGVDFEEFCRLLGMSQLPKSALPTHRLETWKHETKEEWWRYITEYSKGKFQHPFLTLLGKPGVGKTHLAIAVGIEWMAQGKSCLYYQVESLLDALRDGYKLWERGDSDGYHSIIAFTYNAQLLILDDLGAEKQTDWARAKLDQIIDYRYINQKPLIVTSNLTKSEFPERIADRLTEGKIIHIKGESYRSKKAVGSR